MKSAHSCTLSNELRHFSTCCVYFLYLGSFAYAERFTTTDNFSRDALKLRAAHSPPDIAPDLRERSAWLPFALPLPDIPAQGLLTSLQDVCGGEDGKEVNVVSRCTTHPGHDKRTWRCPLARHDAREHPRTSVNGEITLLTLRNMASN